MVPTPNSSPESDLVFDVSGNTSITNIQKSVIKIDPAGNITKLATVQGSTSTALVWTQRDRNDPYASSSQGIISSIIV
ncbi:hypothetical protein ColTof4_01761 [Colletotrichum tofieldiae]|nr:hypothetical protein ColTof4_01761 [Colletotrichum tofieldiae]